MNTERKEHIREALDDWSENRRVSTLEVIPRCPECRATVASGAGGHHPSCSFRERVRQERPTGLQARPAVVTGPGAEGLVVATPGPLRADETWLGGDKRTELQRAAATEARKSVIAQFRRGRFA